MPRKKKYSEEPFGFAGRLPVAPLEGYFPIIWASFWASAISGAILFAADATSKIVSRCSA